MNLFSSQALISIASTLHQPERRRAASEARGCSVIANVGGFLIFVSLHVVVPAMPGMI